MIPFIDLSKQYQQIQNEVNAAIFNVIKSNAFVQGKFVEEFEFSFAQKLKVRNCIGVANGTDALTISLKMLGIKQGDEVITAANTFIATSEAISHCGAVPIFVDHDEFYGIDVRNIESKINQNTKAIIPVHLYGQAVEIEMIQEICKKYNLFMVEDCAQSHFSTFGDHYTGTFGDVATFSFYPGKNLGAYGDGGAIVTNSDELADNIRMYCNHGSRQKHIHQMEGVNSRLDGIQAAVLSVKLLYINQWNEMRFQAAMKYNQLLSDCKQIITPKLRKNANSIFHLYVIQAERRDELQIFLQTQGIQSGLHYKTALPYTECYKKYNYSPDDFPKSYASQSKILSLPMFAEITDEQIEEVCHAILKFYK